MINKSCIIVVINKIESNNLQQPLAAQVEKQVDPDQGSKLTRYRAYLPLVVGLIGLVHIIMEKLF